MHRRPTALATSLAGLVTCALLIILTAPSMVFAGAAAVPVFDLTLDPIVQGAAYIAIEGRRRPWQVERLAIVNFTVEFVNSRAAAPRAAKKRSSKEKKQDGSGDASSASVSTDVIIAPDIAQLQPIVDTLYDLAVEDWRSAGVDVLTPDALGALPAYAALAPALVDTPYRHEASDAGGIRAATVVSAHTLRAYPGAGQTPPVAAELALAKATGITLVAAHFVVDFVLVRDTDDRMFRTKLEPIYAQTVRAAESGFRLIGPDGSVVRALLKNPVRAPESPITLGLRGSYGDEEDEEDPTKPPVQRLAVNAAAYYDQCLRYLGATEDMILAALAAR